MRSLYFNVGLGAVREDKMRDREDLMSLLTLAIVLGLVAGCAPAAPTFTPMPLTTTPVPPTTTPVVPTVTPVPPTATPLPPTATPVLPTLTSLPILAKPDPQLILDRDQAIAYSYNLLLHQGLEQGFEYDNANFARIRFPNGDKGAFIAMGFSGIVRGYQFLYRISNDQAELVELIGRGPDWGIRSLQEFEKVDVEFLELVPDIDGQPKQLLKVTGAGHSGTGLWTDGYFQIIDITDDGIKVIFTGAEAEIDANPGGYHHQYRYQYIDLDGDGGKEIIKEDEECEYRFSEEKGLEKTACESIREVYQFNGTEYVKQPSATPVPPTPSAETLHLPTVAEIMAQGEEIPFEICGESTTWERPAEQEQNAKWWSSGRYAGGNEEVIKYLWIHNFFVVYGTASGEYDITNLSGLWTLPGDVRAKCFEPERHDAILKLQTAEVWALLHRVKSVKRLDTHYVVVVEPMEQGVQFVQFARPERWLPLTLHSVTEDGQEIEKIIEAESPYWPYPQLIPTPQP